MRERGRESGLPQIVCSVRARLYGILTTHLMRQLKWDLLPQRIILTSQSWSQWMSPVFCRSKSKYWRSTTHIYITVLVWYRRFIWLWDSIFHSFFIRPIKGKFTKQKLSKDAFFLQCLGFWIVWQFNRICEFIFFLLLLWLLIFIFLALHEKRFWEKW